MKVEAVEASRIVMIHEQELQHLKTNSLSSHTASTHRESQPDLPRFRLGQTELKRKINPWK